MSDVADMLGIAGKAALSVTDEAMKIMGDKAKGSGKPGKKPKGMSREVFDLLGKDGIMPSTQGNAVVPNFKNKRVNALKGKWIWTAVTSSARQRNDPVFFHWIKADQSYADYPYASFNVQLDLFDYTEEEYHEFLAIDTNWTKTDTDELVAICHRYDMRWPIIADRIELSTYHSVEDMQDRYYHVRAVIRAKRGEAGASASMGGEEEIVSGYDLERERKRRRAQDMVFKKTKEDELEELQLREELKLIDAAIKKNKKMKAAPQEPVATTVNNAQGSSSSKAGANEPLPVVVGAGSSLVARSILAPPEAVGAAAAAVGKGAATAPAPIVATGPVPGKPALQSSRLYSGIVPPVHLTGAVGDIGITKLDLGMSGASLSKKMLLKMTMYLRELDVPETPLPTRAVCDLVETVKQDAVTLLSLHNVIAKKEKELVQLTAVSRSTDSGAGSSKGKSGGRASQGGKVGRAGTSTETSATAAGCTDAMGAVKIEPDGEFANAVDRASFAMDVDE